MRHEMRTVVVATRGLAAGRMAGATGDLSLRRRAGRGPTRRPPCVGLPLQTWARGRTGRRAGPTPGPGRGAAQDRDDRARPGRPSLTQAESRAASRVAFLARRPGRGRRRCASRAADACARARAARAAALSPAAASTGPSTMPRAGMRRCSRSAAGAEAKRPAARPLGAHAAGRSVHDLQATVQALALRWGAGRTPAPRRRGHWPRVSVPASRTRHDRRPSFKVWPIQLDRAAGHMHIGRGGHRPASGEAAFLAVEQAGVDCARPGGSPANPAHRRAEMISRSWPRFSASGKDFSWVARRRAGHVGPTIQICRKVHLLPIRAVELAIASRREPALISCTSARADYRAAAHRVLVRQRAFQHVGEDLHVAVRLGCRSPGPGRRDRRWIHAQVREADELRVCSSGRKEKV